MRSAWWAVSLSVVTIAICITYYNTNRDPRVAAMERCVAGWPNGEKQVACAQAIFKGEQ
jgi:hypothetical protein